MYLAVKNVIPTNNYNLILTFENGVKRQFDMNPYLNTGIFNELRDISKFQSVRVRFDSTGGIYTPTENVYVAIPFGR